jgi:hypothetical protein
MANHLNHRYMEQFNSNTYKKQSPWQEFTHSCLGKVVILAVIVCILILLAAITRPTESMVRWQMEDNIQQCLQGSDSIQSDIIDDYVANIGRMFTHADTTETNPEQYATYKKLNQLKVYTHMLYRSAHIVNNIHPEGIRVGVGIFGIVIPTIKYSDMLMNTGAVRGEYGGRLIREEIVVPEDLGENPNIQPFHYKGNPDD